MAHHYAATGFLLVALLVTTAAASAMAMASTTAASATATISATDAVQEKGAIGYMRREFMYMVFVKAPKSPVYVAPKQYYLSILTDALNISEKQAEKMLVIGCSLKFIAKLTLAQALKLSNYTRVTGVLRQGSARCTRQDDMNN